MNYFTRTILAVLLISSMVMPAQVSTVHASNLYISNLSTEVLGNDVIVSWTTNEKTNGCVQFGLTTNYEYQICSVVDATYEHRLLMQNLNPESVYHFRVTSRTSFGDETSSFDTTVKTGKEADTTAPTIGNIILEYVGGTAVYMRWETNEETTTEVEYGEGYAFDQTYRSRQLTTSHEALIRNLEPGTLYSYRVSAVDGDGNKTTSMHQQVRTHYTQTIDTNDLTITDVRPASINDIFVQETRATISWRSSRPTKATIYYGTDPDHLRSKITIDEYRTYHEVPLEGLAMGTQYYFRIETADVFRNRLTVPSKDSQYSFTTKGRTVTVSQQTYSSSSSSSNTNTSPYSTVQPARLTQLNARINSAPQVLGAYTTRFTPATALLQPIHESAVYAIVNNQRHHITNQEIMSSYGYLWSEVDRVPQTNVDTYKVARLMKTPDNATVYYVYVEKGIKIAIPSESVFTSYPTNRWGDVITVSDADLNQYKTATLVRAMGSEEIYLLENGKRRLILTDTPFTARVYSYDDVVSINQTHLESYPLGTAIK